MDVLKLLAEEAAHKDLLEPSSVKLKLLLCGLPDERVVAEAVTARAMAVTEAGSCSGGETCQRWSGFKSSS